MTNAGLKKLHPSFNQLDQDDVMDEEIWKNACCSGSFVLWLGKICLK